MKNLFGEGLWLILVIPFLASLWFFFVAYKKSKSGSEKQLPGGGYDYSDTNVPIYQIGQFWFSLFSVVKGNGKAYKRYANFKR